MYPYAINASASRWLWNPAMKGSGMSDYERLCERIDATVAELAGEAIALSDAMAAEPEISEEEYKSSQAHVAFLRKVGFKVEYPYFGLATAYNATLREGTRAKVALLAEYDALPGIGHACGHNVHGAMSLLAGAALAPLVKELGVELRVVGTPAEETNGAKVAMAAGGVFDGLDLALMIHAGNSESVVRYRCLAMDGLEFTFKGKASHAAASPWEGRNALNGAQLFFHAIDMLRQHVTPEVRMHGIYVDAGKACNIVPEEAVVRFYFRAGRRRYLDGLLAKVYNAARGAALATDTEVEWRNHELSFDELVPNEAAEAMMEAIYDELGVRYGPETGPDGSSDVGNVSQRCPTLQPMLPITEGPLALHTREFAAATTSPLGHAAIALGARLLARAALRTFLDPRARSAMREGLASIRGEP